MDWPRERRVHRIAGGVRTYLSRAQAERYLPFNLLRQALPEADRFLQADAQTLRWRPEAPFRLDVADFESAAQSSSLMALQQAVDPVHLGT